MTVVAFACVGLIAGAVGAAGIDMASEFLSGTEVAGPGDEATYTVQYSNLSASVPVGAYLNVDFPVGAFINDDNFEVFAEDTLGNEAGLYISSSCENLLVQLQGPGLDEDRPIPLNLPANTAGEITISMMLPMEAATTRAVMVQYPGEAYQDLPFSYGACDDCDDFSTCFGPRVSSIIPAIESEFVIVDDGSGSTGSLGCVSIKNDVAGKIALIRRGECEFGLKAVNAQIAGALGAVIMNNDPNQDVASFVMSGGEFGALVEIPVGIINNSVADPMEQAIENGDTLMGIMGGVPATTLLYESTIFHSGDTDQDPDPSNDTDTFTTVISSGPLPPTAMFSYVADELMVTFTDESTGAPTSWAWDFGDNAGTSTEQNPTYTYAADGTYTVTLTATNDAGSDEYSMDVMVAMGGTAPTASFTVTTDMLTAMFMDTSTGAPTMWDWDFGDGMGTSTEQNPTYTYAEAGTYNVALTASNDIGFDVYAMDVTVDEGGGPFVCENIYVAAAGSAPGLGGSMWATDAGINNLGADPIMYAFKFFPRGADNGSVEMSDPYTLAGNASVGYADIWMAMTGESGFGAFAVCSDTPMHTGVNTRTYNTSDAGTFGQTIPGMTTLIGQEKVRLGFLSQNDMFRTNIGFMNGMGASATIGIEFFTADGTSLGTDTIGLLPYSNNQWSEAFKRVTEDDVDFGYVDVWAESENAGYLVYASIVDNATGDPTTIWPF